MEKMIADIVKNYDIVHGEKTVSEVYEINEIEYVVLYSANRIQINALNLKTNRFAKLDSKKYFKLVSALKRDDVNISFKDGRILIELNIKKTIKVKFIGYCRVSTKGQLDGNSIEEQSKRILERYPAANIVEESFSAAKERPIFNNIINSLNRGDTLIVTKLDRFCRSTKEGLEYIDRLMNKGVKIHILNMGLIEDTPMPSLIVPNLLAFAEFERAMILERTQSGKAIAKAKPGFTEGRPKVYTKEQLDNALSMLIVNGGTKSYKEVERILGISKSTLIRENNKRKINN